MASLSTSEIRGWASLALLGAIVGGLIAESNQYDSLSEVQDGAALGATIGVGIGIAAFLSGRRADRVM